MTEPGVCKLQGEIGNSDLDALARPSLQHVGVMVKNIEETMEYLFKIWGIDSFQTLEYSPPKDRMKVGEPFKLKMANANLFGILLHISQSIEDDATILKNYPNWYRFLRQEDGIQHICVSVDNWEEVVAKVQERGGRVYASGAYEGRRWAHIAAGPGGIVVEIEERA